MRIFLDIHDEHGVLTYQTICVFKGRCQHCHVLYMYMVDVHGCIAVSHDMNIITHMHSYISE